MHKTMGISRGNDVLRQSTGPVRWMANASHHRALIDRRLYVADANLVTEVTGETPSRWLRTDQLHCRFGDPVIQRLSDRFPHLRSVTDGGLWQGLFSSITAQAVSLLSAAAFQRRLCEAFSPEIVFQDRTFRSLPRAGDVAEASVPLLKSSGLTTRRAEGLRTVAIEVAAGNVPHPDDEDADYWMRQIDALPMVGPWTAASTLLWGLGHPDVYAPGDVALLRAARRAYNQPDMTMPGLHRISESWRPQRSIAARLLWTDLLGAGWEDAH